VSSRVPSGSRSWRSPPSTLLRVPPMEVERFKHRQLAPTVGRSSRSSGEFEGPLFKIKLPQQLHISTRRQVPTTAELTSNLILFRIPKSSIPYTRRPPLLASGLVESVQDSKALYPLRSKDKLLAPAGGKIKSQNSIRIT
jgi:hypothetical protein